ncbi:MAG: pentapeptide repeat-containing protein, partial [Gammaproteobacteria bacterium]|nr:pentapeptide repeat-containing protein [Gammaproteobacteria bacterium]
MYKNCKNLITCIFLFTISPSIASAACADAASPKVNWDGCNKAKQDFQKVDLTNAVLKNTNFDNSNLKKADLAGADLGSASLNDAIIDNIKAKKARFVGASLKNT